MEVTECTRGVCDVGMGCVAEDKRVVVCLVAEDETPPGRRFRSGEVGEAGAVIICDGFGEGREAENVSIVFLVGEDLAVAAEGRIVVGKMGFLARPEAL